MATAKKSRKDTVAILGPGRVGTAVGFLLRSAGYEITALAGRSAKSCRSAIPFTGGKIYPSAAEAASRARCILITVSDDAIQGVCDAVAESTPLKGKKVIHMSGAGGLDLLRSARDAGARVGSIHPIQSFADVRGAIENIPGSTFGITVDDRIRTWAVRFVRDLGGQPFLVSESDKPLYHAAACLASNYLVTLMHAAEEIYLSLGLSPEKAVRAFWPLVKGTIRNIESKGTVQSLTGPIARGDIGTVEKHLSAFQDDLETLIDFYCRTGLLTVDVALKKGTLSLPKALEIKSLFNRRKKT
jgi:predicted short-subunit dehydrogenase-like oxidoreductase (DUF2520 family)